MQRVAVIGTGGAGKTTFANRLGARLGLPVVHLDEIFWRPDWVPTPREEWRCWQEERFAADCWIADGGYGRTVDTRLARADTVVLLEPRGWRCVWAAVWRSVRHHGQAIQAPCCPERFLLFDPTPSAASGTWAARATATMPPSPTTPTISK